MSTITVHAPDIPDVDHDALAATIAAEIDRLAALAVRRQAEREHLDAVAAATAARTDAEAAWATAVTTAAAAGIRHADLAAATGLSRQRISQIVAAH